MILLRKDEYNDSLNRCLAQSIGAVEYIDYFSADR